MTWPPNTIFFLSSGESSLLPQSETVLFPLLCQSLTHVSRSEQELCFSPWCWSASAPVIIHCSVSRSPTQCYVCTSLATITLPRGTGVSLSVLFPLDFMPLEASEFCLSIILRASDAVLYLVIPQYLLVDLLAYTTVLWKTQQGRNTHNLTSVNICICGLISFSMGNILLKGNIRFKCSPMSSKHETSVWNVTFLICMQNWDTLSNPVLERHR